MRVKSNENAAQIAPGQNRASGRKARSSRVKGNSLRACIVFALIGAAGVAVSLHAGWGVAARSKEASPTAQSMQTAPPSYTLFESGQVRPLALSPDRSRLFAVNTPDGSLEVFDIRPHGLTHRASIPVGLEPVAVAARSDSEVWVVNHLSDSISIVNVGQGEPNRVVRTLLVGDEPRDIVFAGPQKRRAFTSHCRSPIRRIRFARSTTRSPPISSPDAICISTSPRRSA